MVQKYYVIEITGIQLSELSRTKDLYRDYGLLGVEEFSMEEAEVDKLLGKRSYSGADLPESVLNEVDEFKTFNSQDMRKLYFENEDNAKKFLDIFKDQFNQEVLIKELKNTDWNESWKSSYSPIEINEDNILIPSWENALNYNYRNIVKIYPGMGFGTGNHETTYLCLKLLVDSLNLDEVKNCMDFGCGSGILGIFANKLKKMELTDFYDIDQSALDNCEQNLSVNQLDFTSRLLLPSHRNSFKESYDLVFANILQNVLISESSALTSISSKYLVLSGLLSGQEDEVLKYYKNFTVRKILRKNDWCALLLMRK